MVDSRHELSLCLDSKMTVNSAGVDCEGIPRDK